MTSWLEFVLLAAENVCYKLRAARNCMSATHTNEYMNLRTYDMAKRAHVCMLYVIERNRVCRWLLRSASSAAAEFIADIFLCPLEVGAVQAELYA